MLLLLRAVSPLLLLCLLATASRAQLLWQQTMGTSTQEETSTAFLAVPGGFLHVGQGGNDQLNSFPNRIYLSKVSAAGVIAWQKSPSFAYRNIKVLYPTGAAADATGQVYVSNQCFTITRTAGQPVSYSFGMLVKFSATGDTLWSKVLRGLTRSAYGNVVATADGGAVVIGENDADPFIAKFSASGQLLWQRSYPYSSTVPGYLQNLVQTTGGFLVANIPSCGCGVPCKYLVLDGQGQKITEKPALYRGYYYMETDAVGNVLAGSGRFYKISAMGDTLWSRKYTQYGRDVEVRLAVPVPGTSHYLLAGTRYNYIDYDLSLLLVDQNGTKLRDTLLLRYGSNEYPTGLHFDAQGNYLVGGYVDDNGPLGRTDQFAFLLRSWNRLLPSRATASALAGYALYPNPATERVQVQTPQGTAYAGAYELRDARSQLVQAGPGVPAGGLPMASLPAGLCLLRLREGERWLPALRLMHY